MAKIEGFRVRNFRTLKDVTFGKLSNEQDQKPLTPMTVVIGKNGVGKSSLFDAFGFLLDCLKFGAEEACEMNDRGGFHRLRSQGTEDKVQFDILFRENKSSNVFIYQLALNFDTNTGKTFVSTEHLLERQESKLIPHLFFSHGMGIVWEGDSNKIPLAPSLEEIRASSDDPKSLALNTDLRDKQKLAIATFGTLKDHPRISAFFEFLEGWHLSYFSPDAARSLPLSGAQKHLNKHGNNLSNVVQFMQREHPEEFQNILNRIATKIPGIDKIGTVVTPDDRLLLQFNNKGFQDPFYASQMSDGTLKVFAYMLLLEDPTPPPFICIEEPENGLYHKLLETLVQEIRSHATGEDNTPQFFITTHQPYLVDALKPEEVWIMEKGDDGFATIRRASDDATVNALVAEGLPLGGLWYSDYLEAK